MVRIVPHSSGRFWFVSWFALLRSVPFSAQSRLRTRWWRRSCCRASNSRTKTRFGSRFCCLPCCRDFSLAATCRTLACLRSSLPVVLLSHRQCCIARDAAGCSGAVVAILQEADAPGGAAGGKPGLLVSQGSMLSVVSTENIAELFSPLSQNRSVRFPFPNAQSRWCGHWRVAPIARLRCAACGGCPVVNNVTRLDVF